MQALLAPTRGHVPASKHLKYIAIKVHNHIIYSDIGIYAKERTFEIFLYKSAHLIYLEKGMYAKQ